MELFHPEWAKDVTWTRFRDAVLIFYGIYIPLWLIFNIGFINPVADFLLGYVSTFAPAILLFVFPFSRFNSGVRKAVATILIIVQLAFLPYLLLFQLFLTQDVFRTGYNASLKLMETHPLGDYQREAIYQGNCGAMCSFNYFSVREIVLLSLIKLEIPNSRINLPNNWLKTDEKPMETPTQSPINSLEKYDLHLKIFCANEDKEEFRACLYATIMNDAISSGSYKMFAQQELQAIDGQTARGLTDIEIQTELLSDLGALMKKYDLETGLRAMAYHAELGGQRQLKNAEIDHLIESMLTTYGPCWGIPEGQCRE